MMKPHCEPTELARRLRQVRLDCYGEDGAPELARDLGIPTRTWLNFERGVVPPAPILLGLMALTGVEAAWLATGRGAQFRVASRVNRDRIPPIAR